MFSRWAPQRLLPWRRVASHTLLHTTVVLLLLLRTALAPIPCGPELLIEVTVGDRTAQVGFSSTFDHGTSEDRTCQLVHPGYEGMIVIRCEEGQLNATAEDCTPARCPPYTSLSVAIGEESTSVSPLATIFSGGVEERLCREMSPLYRGKFFLFCNYGALSVDIGLCLPQYDAMQAPPLAARARHSAVTMGDGALLVMGGLGDDGPLRDVWQWTPTGFWDIAPVPPYRGQLGTWEQPWAVPVPPWSGRYGAAAVWQVREGTEQVTLLGGNDYFNRNDVWRWLRAPSLVRLALGASDPTGTQPEDCRLLSGPTLRCTADAGVSGRRWYLSDYLRPSTQVRARVRQRGTGGEEGAAIFAVQLGPCRQVFQHLHEQWSTYGCSGDDPPWAQPEMPRPLGTKGAPGQGAWRDLLLTLDHQSRQMQLSVDGRELPPVVVPPLPGTPSAAGPAAEEAFCQRAAGQRSGIACQARRPHVPLVAIEVAAWPGSILEVQDLAVMAPAGYWERLVDEAPWEARSTHAAVGLPDGDLLLMGGIGDGSLLNDVWRWSPKKCTLLPETSAAEAARYALECSYQDQCNSSTIHGQWKRLPNAPWAPRQEHAAIWTSVGALVLGGRTAMGYENDVWRWTSSGPFCSLAWEGRWEQLTAAASWPARIGHSIVGFAPPGASAVETVLLFGGFGGAPESKHVREEVLKSPIQMRNDLWCGNAALGNFTQWMQLAPYSPFSARTQMSMLETPTLGSYSMLFFGGYDRNARFTADFWRWSGENATAACKVED